MFETFRNAWKIPEVRSKILYTLLLLFVFRLGNFITTPFIDLAAVQNIVNGNDMLGLLNTFNGGAVSNFTILATGITPYITASIVLQLLTVAIPPLERLMKEGGEEGRKKITEITRYSSILLSLIQTGGYLIGFHNSIMTDQSWYAFLTILLVQAAGAAFSMWIGERITDRGIGNGISLLVFINIVSRIPINIRQAAGTGESANWVAVIGFIVMSLALIAAVNYIDLGQRRIPVQYAKRMMGRKVYGGQSTHIPLKLNNSGVMPLIFAMTLVSFPGMILTNFQNMNTGFGHFALSYVTVMASKKPLYIVIQCFLILFFTYFYSQISFNPIDISKNIQQYGGFIPGIRPGRPTSDYLLRVSNRINLFSGTFFMLLSLVPVTYSLLIPTLQNTFGATSMLILVGVALETTKQLEAQMLMRHYKGFLN